VEEGGFLAIFDFAFWRIVILSPTDLGADEDNVATAG
jgi:hypothetical protein